MQEACLFALLRPEKRDDLAPLLADAVRRLARRARSSERHRREREKRAARPEAQPSALDVVAEQEVLRELYFAVERLQEPYRRAIRMRFLDDLPQELANDQE